MAVETIQNETEGKNQTEKNMNNELWENFKRPKHV